MNRGPVLRINRINRTNRGCGIASSSSSPVADESVESRRDLQVKKGNKIPITANIAPSPVVRRGFDDDVYVSFMENHRTMADFVKRVERCLGVLESILPTLGPQWKVAPFGSAVTGFRTATSDLNVTFFTEQDDSRSQTAYLFLKIPLLSGLPGFKIVNTSYEEKLLVDFMFEDNLLVKVSCYDTVSLANTRLLKSYAGLGGVASFVVAIKLWAKAVGVCGEGERMLSSYTITLLAIYFLQVHEDVKLPCLPTDDGRVACSRASNFICPHRLPELLRQFFTFYASKFEWGREVVSVRVGKRLRKDHRCFASLAAKRAGLDIEDPCSLQQTNSWNQSHRGFGKQKSQQLRTTFQDTVKCIEAGGTPVGFQPTITARLRFDQTTAQNVSQGQVGAETLFNAGSERTTVVESGSTGNIIRVDVADQ